jgi:predicted dehydrogenase
MDRHVPYSFEYDRKVTACFIGSGGHSFRNIYPTFQYAPVHLVAICDRDQTRAAIYARQFGAQRHYTDYREMLARERPEAVFIVTGFDEEGKPRSTRIALDALRAGAHVWTEKPTASSVQDVDELMRASEDAGRYVMTGLKKIFTPAVVKVKALMDSEEFGRPSSIYVRYPQAMPGPSARRSLPAVKWLLDHIWHPASIIHYLMGRIERLSYEWEPHTGGSVTSLRFQSGAIGTLHFAAGSSWSSPLERLEVVGEEANVVVDNGVSVTYYRPAEELSYGRAGSYMVPDDVAPLHWEPEFSLGNLYNKALFLLGYAPEVIHFCESILTGRPPEKGTLKDSLEIAKLFEAYRDNPPGTLVTLNGPKAAARSVGEQVVTEPTGRGSDE